MSHIDPYENRAEDYASCRPPYAPEAFDALADITGLDASWIVADIASGTGNVTESLLKRVDTVYAVEPSDEMRRVAERSLGCHEGFFSLNATAEATGLPSGCVDLIIVGQGLHWFDARRAKEEFARILKPGGWLAEIRNLFDGSEPPAIEGYFLNGEVIRRSYPMSVREPWERFIGGARSAAHAPLPGDRDYDAFVREKRILFEKQAIEGLIEVEYVTLLSVGRLDRPVVV